MGVTVKQFLKAGFKLVEGDEVKESPSTVTCVTAKMANAANAVGSNIQALDSVIKTLAWRKKHGIQPVHDNCHVILKEGGRNPGYKKCIASEVMWDDSSWHPVWHPDLEEIERSLNGDNLNINKNNKPTLTVAFTGSFTEINRGEARYIAGEHGLKCQGSVTKDLDLLVFGKASGSKLDKAKCMGIECITCSEFLSRYPHPDKEAQHNYWDGKSKIQVGQVYLNDDGQLCEYVGTHVSSIVGRLVEHPVPNSDLTICNWAHCRKVMTDAEKQERVIEELADNACEEAFGYSIQNCRPDVANTVRALVEAGYRKENDNGQ